MDAYENLFAVVSMEELLELLTYLVNISEDLPNIIEKKLNIDYKKFKYSVKECWIDKETRNSLFNLLNSLDEKSNFDLIVGDEIVKLPVSKVKRFLTALEQYASICKVQTLKHVNNIKDIKNVEDLLKYDYTLGYPNQINLNDFI